MVGHYTSRSLGAKSSAMELPPKEMTGRNNQFPQWWPEDVTTLWHLLVAELQSSKDTHIHVHTQKLKTARETIYIT